MNRETILQLLPAFHRSRPKPEFVAGETYIPAASKVLDEDDLVNLVDAALDLHLTADRYAEAFEERLAERAGTRFARLTVSGSAANLLAFSCLTSSQLGERRLSPGSEVITVAAGFPTTVAPIIQNRCVPVFVDIDLETCNVDPARLADAVGPKTRAIMIAHTLGNPFDLDAVTAVAKRHDLYLIEDCCDALGSTYDGTPVGTFGDLATLSFYPAHHITTGEGGAVLSNDETYVRLVESFRDWGRDCWCKPGMDDACGKRFGLQLGTLPYGYDHKFVYSHVGYNLRITDLQAALGCSQLDKVDHFIARRRENFQRLKRMFIADGLEEYFHLPKATPKSEPSWFGFPLTLRDGVPFERLEMVQFLESRRIGTRLLFAGNLTRQPAFQDVEYRQVADLAVTDKVMRDAFWIGVWPGIEQAHIDYIVEAFRDFVKKKAKVP